MKFVVSVYCERREGSVSTVARCVQGDQADWRHRMGLSGGKDFFFLSFFHLFSLLNGFNLLLIGNYYLSLLGSSASAEFEGFAWRGTGRHCGQGEVMGL